MNALTLLATALAVCQAVLVAAVKVLRPGDRIVSRLVYFFMANVAILTIFVGVTFVRQLSGNKLSVPTASGSSVDLTSGFPSSYFEGEWQIVDGRDTALDSFKPRNLYSGIYRGSVEGANLVLEGDISTLDAANNKSKGVGRWKFVGPISNNQAAGYYTYTNASVAGFGTAFIQFDGAGAAKMYVIFRVTRPTASEPTVGAAEIDIQRNTGTNS